MSLRLRLLLVLLAVVGTTSLFSSFGAALNLHIKREVDTLTRLTKTPIVPDAVVGLALAGDGKWHAGGWFELDDIERLSVTRRPKLRGTIQAVAEPTFTLFGIVLHVTAETEFTDQPEPGQAGPNLRVGQRVEVSCSVGDDGVWTARKLSASPAKGSDKIKGTITAARRDGDAIELSVHGLRLRAAADARMSAPQGPLYRIANATELTVALQDCLTAAHELLAQHYRRRELLARGSEATAVAAAIDAAEERLQDGYESLTETIAQAMPADASVHAEDERAQLRALVASLDRERAGLATELAAFRASAALDPEAAEQILRRQIEPRVRQRVLPTAQAHQVHAEEQLSSELRGIAVRAEDAAQLGLLANGLGVLIALALGLLASRSITRPLGKLRDAAARIGRGELTTRSGLQGHDEIGTLASTMDKMAAELAANTVSIGKLSRVLDSMAGALLLLDADGVITTANPAAGALLGYHHQELCGRRFASLCDDESALQGAGAPRELTLRHRDGHGVAVSFSSAELREAGDIARGYVCVAQDLTARQRLEAQLRASIGEQELLLREIHHRVKNSLQVISSLLALQARDVSDPSVLELFQVSQDRIQSLVFVHDQLYRTRQRGRVDLRAYLGLLATHLAQAHGARAGGRHAVALTVAIEPLELDVDRAQACGLLVNELLTNAYKHAFSGRDDGKLDLVCRRSEIDHVILEVRDDGRGLAADPAAERGDRGGMTLVGTLVRQLRGTLQVEHDQGARFRVTFPLASPVAPA